MQRVIRLEVEIAADERGLGQEVGLERVAGHLGHRPQPRVRVAVGVDVAQRLDLARALLRRVVLEMGGDHAHVTERRLHDGFDGNPRHALHPWIHRERQQMAERLRHRQARQDHVAEAPSPAVLPRMVRTDAGDGRVLRQQRAEGCELVLVGRARQARIGEVVGDLLQAQHVEVGEAPRLGDDARRIDAPVDAAAPLGVPGDENHERGASGSKAMSNKAGGS